LAQAGRFQEAVGMLQTLHNPESRLELAAVLEMQGNRERALEMLLDLEKSPAVAEKANRGIARLLLASGRYGEAADRLATLLQKTPNDLELQREIIDAAAAMEHPDNAAREAVLRIYQERRDKRFASLNANDFERFSDALRRLGLSNEANVMLETAVTEFPSSRRLRFYLAETLGSLGRYDDAETQYRMLLDARAARP
jgi:tetratricopeptide (TPR) repeat protein